MNKTSAGRFSAAEINEQVINTEFHRYLSLLSRDLFLSAGVLVEQSACGWAQPIPCTAFPVLPCADVELQLQTLCCGVFLGLGRSGFLINPE